MKITLAQINPIVGDLPGNVKRCLEAIQIARADNPDLIVFPEMALPGYPPQDILCDPGFTRAANDAIDDLARQTKGGPPIIIGTIMPSGRPLPHHPGLYNTAALLERGEATPIAEKRLLPAYDVFHEPRWFLPGRPSTPLDVAGKKLGLLVCEDLWDEGCAIHPPADLISAGADALVCLSASPYRRGILAKRLYHARRAGCAVVYVNLCGGNDELIFDGRSFVLNRRGDLVAQLPGFEPAVRTIDLEQAAPISAPEEAPSAELFQALALGLHDFAAKNSLRRAFVGLSGGIDSAVVAVIAAHALGPENVTAVAIPSRYTDPRSTETARQLAYNLGLAFEVIPLEPLHAAAETLLGDRLKGGVTAENVQARLRMVILMSLVNQHGGFLLNTGNKTELTLGYATLYGDMAGAISPLGDVTKPEVMALARHINAPKEVIPAFILERPPSAELRPDQVDPFDYATVSPAVEALVQANRSNGPMRQSEHKRRQAGVILKVSEKAFGSGRLIPITRR